MPLPSKRNPQDIASSLEAWFADKFKHPCSIKDVGIPTGTGMSSETILFTLHHDGLVEPMVARIRPSMQDWPVFPVYDLDAQVQAMQLVAARSQVPVPTIRFIEKSEDLLGDPFFVMDRVNGDAPPDVPRTANADRRFMQIHFVDRDPRKGWDKGYAKYGEALNESGVATHLWTAPFIQTVFGTDKYTDQL